MYLAGASVNVVKALPMRECDGCAMLIAYWREHEEDGGWEPLGIDGLLHACRPRPLPTGCGLSGTASRERCGTGRRR